MALSRGRRPFAGTVAAVVTALLWGFAAPAMKADETGGGSNTVYVSETTHKCKDGLKTIREVTASWSSDGALVGLSTNKSGRLTEVTGAIVKQNDKELPISTGGDTGGTFTVSVSGAAPGDGANVELLVQPIGTCGFTAKPKEDNSAN